MQDMQGKIKELFETGIDSALFKSSSLDLGFYYFTGLPKEISGSNLLILKKNKMILLANPLEKKLIEKEVKKAENKKAKTKIKLIEFKDRENLQKLLRTHLGKAIGIDFEGHSYSGIKNLKKIINPKIEKKTKSKNPAFNFKDISKKLHSLRETKTNSEIRKIRHASRISELIIEDLKSKFRTGVTEKQIKSELEKSVLENECRISFDTIVSFGKNTSMPHSLPSNKKLRKGNLILMDFGTCYRNYTSDISRVFSFGKAGKKEKEAYNMVNSCMNSTIKELCSGNKASNAFFATENILKKQGFSSKHAVGHGIGMQVHDFPKGIGKKSNWKFKEGNCLAIEPAVYTKNFGIRIEDNFLIEKNKAKRFTKAPEELEEIK